MKKLSCKAMGTDCDFEAVGANEDEVIQKMQQHAKSDHPDKWAEMEQMNDEEKKNMIKDMKEKMEEV